MLALDIMLAALAQSPVASAVPNAAPVQGPDVQVVAPQPRVICRTIIPSGSHITARRVCQTFAQADADRDRMQDEASADVASTMRRTNEMLENSSYGNWIRAHRGQSVSETHLPN